MGLALSFAAQDTIGNLISGIVIIIDGPFSEGDWISMGEMHATVTEIRLRTTVLTTFDNETIVVPNKQLAQERVVNYTMTPQTRVRVSVGIAYKEDTEQARKIMLGTLQGDSRILSKPAPAVWVTGLADSSVSMQLRFWTQDPLDKFPLMFEYTEKCKKALDKAGIEIPYPHLQLLLNGPKAWRCWPRRMKKRLEKYRFFELCMKGLAVSKFLELNQANVALAAAFRCGLAFVRASLYR
jgi:small-conductance mechanosensitive channel